MGQVYRADDLRLGQTVALKFLPEKVAQDGAALARFHREVRIARQVSHPNVCRVFDIGEADGVPFLTMEYVDGEDLASLLRRIGRLPPDKALEIARQLCAGLNAAHERGVLHRDLKPSNVMLDGQGKVRITDFGLAGLAEDLRGDELGAGTPVYMAPEQLDGKEVTVQSDLYSLGLVLYEVFTGKRAYDASTLAELVRLRERSTPTSPSNLVKDLHPLVERIILRCLERDPRKRPASALQVAAALPGGDPLAAALAAGETPSPEMVAAAGETEGLHPGMAALYLSVVFAGLIAIAPLSDRAKLTGVVPLDNSPEVLAAKAREITRHVGYSDPPVDNAHGFLQDADYLRYIIEHDKSASRWNVLQSNEPPAIVFWYRQSPRYLEPRFFLEGHPGQVTTGDPPRAVSGMIFVMLDPRGRLVHFEAIPPQVDDARGSAPEPNWNALFSAAGLDPANFRPADPKWAPLAWGDKRVAWTGLWPARPDVPLRVEAAAYRGKAIYFDLISPWDRPGRMQPYQLTRQQRAGQAIGLVLLGTLLVGGVWMARRNLRLGRGDQRGAFRLALFIFVVLLASWACVTSHVPTAHEVLTFVMAASIALFFASLSWVLYLALEPHVRRRWPHAMISWTRLLAGQIRDPLVGRDVLVGIVFGVGFAILDLVRLLMSSWIGKAPREPMPITPDTLAGPLRLAGQFLAIIPIHMALALAIFFVFFLLRLLLRKEWLAAVVFGIVFTVPALLGEDPFLLAISVVLELAAMVFLMKRIGLAAFCVALIGSTILNSWPITTHFSRWYAGTAFFSLAIVLALAVYGFRTTLAGRPVFGNLALDE